MANKRFLKTTFLAAGVASVVAPGHMLIRVQATTTFQPFVAIMVEEVTPRPDQPPTPITRLQTIAVRSDGSISKVSKWDVRLPSRVLYSREVVDAATKTHVFVEDHTRTIVNDKYRELQVLKANVPCGGKPAGQMQGFDVVYAEGPMESSDKDSHIIHKVWAAQQLGCYPIVQEWVGTIHSQFNDTKQMLASIKVGEPDPWYFNVPTSYTVRTTNEWMELMKPLLKQ